jgi:uncharacterized protein YajQ (UPF0234 family)
MNNAELTEAIQTVAKTLEDLSKLVYKKLTQASDAMFRLEHHAELLETKLLKMQCSLELMDIKDPTPDQMSEWLKSKSGASEEVLEKYQEMIKGTVKIAQDQLKQFFKNIGK